jgi:hypothetical protein
MDAAFIERNQIVERYLAGRLPLKGAQDFERFCREHPETVVALGLPERINAGLRLLEAGGQPEPWTEAKPAFWQKPAVIASVAAAAVLFAITTIWLLVDSGQQERTLAQLEERVKSQPLLPVASTRAVNVLPAGFGVAGSGVATIGGRRTELADFRIDVSKSRYTNFRVTVDRVDQGRVLVLGSLQRDSNGQLRIGLNSSALGPGQYAVQLEGMDWRGTPHAEASFSFSVAR